MLFFHKIKIKKVDEAKPRMKRGQGQVRERYIIILIKVNLLTREHNDGTAGDVMPLHILVLSRVEFFPVWVSSGFPGFLLYHRNILVWLNWPRR